MVELKDLKILYVEDEEMIRSAICRNLSRVAKSVTIAENGQIGFSTFCSASFDVVLTDIEMPVMNGLEMIRLIKAKAPNTPIVVLTAYKDEAHQSPLADITLHKPVSVALLRDALVEAFIKYRD